MRLPPEPYNLAHPPIPVSAYREPRRDQMNDVWRHSFARLVEEAFAAIGAEEATGDDEDRTTVPRWLRWAQVQGVPLFAWDEPRFVNGILYPRWRLRLGHRASIDSYPADGGADDLPFLEFAFDLGRWKLLGSLDYDWRRIG